MDTRCTECLKKGISHEMILIKTARGEPLWKCEKCGYRWTYPSTAQPLNLARITENPLQALEDLVVQEKQRKVPTDG